ncbi:MAG: glycosyltransferase family 9 protein [Desulfovibrionaceae bacterium]
MPPHAPHPAPAAAQRLAAVLRLSALGDVALTTGVLHRVFQRTGTRFIYITRAALAPLLAGNPAIAAVHAVDETRLRGAAWAEQAAEIASALAERCPGLPLYDLHGTLRARVLAARWPGPVTRYPKFSLARRLFRLTRLGALRRFLERLSVPQRYALAFEPEGVPAADLLPRLFLAPAEVARGRELVRAALPPAAPDSADAPRPVALHPYATHPDKAWPREHWLELARLLDQRGVPWLVVGRDPEPLFPGDPRDLTGRTDLRATCAVLAACAALATNDSGPMHLAGGVNTPVVALFGPTARAWGFAPRGPRDVVLERDLPCRPCTLHGDHRCRHGRACLTDIPPAAVLEALLGQTAPDHAPAPGPDHAPAPGPAPDKDKEAPS